MCRTFENVLCSSDKSVKVLKIIQEKERSLPPPRLFSDFPRTVVLVMADISSVIDDPILLCVIGLMR